MTPDYDRDTLFLAPPARRDAEAPDLTPSAISRRAEAMQTLQNPFATHAGPGGGSPR